MRAQTHVAGSLDLETAADRVITHGFDRTPSLITARSLENDIGLLAGHTSDMLRDEFSVSTETIAMPRRGFGSRPVQISSLIAHVLLEALTDSVGNALAPATRVAGAHKRHKRFGLESNAEYIVDFDIVACYEYIEHDQLLRELYVQGAAPRNAQAIVELLGDMNGRQRGLPQLVSASDRLADTYLSLLDRQVLRNGWELSRFVDDYRVIAHDWPTANEVLDKVVESARDIGLVVSQAKSGARRRDRLSQEATDEDQAIKDYFARAANVTVEIVEIETDYGTTSVLRLANGDEIDAVAWHDFLQDWYTMDRESRAEEWRHLYLNTALQGASSAPERLHDDILQQIVFRFPTRLDAVCRYILARSADSGSWATLKELVNMEQRSPWTKLWLIDAVEQLMQFQHEAPESQMMEWVHKQLQDRHEIVRAQAAWVATTDGAGLDDDQVWDLYSRSSDISSHALAAVAGRSGNVSAQMLHAVKGDSVLNRRAAAWGEARRP